MDNILSRVLETEASATRHIEAAREKAHLMVSRAREEALQQQEIAKRRLAVEQQEILSRAKDDADSLRRSALENAAQKAEALRQVASGLIDKTAEKFFYNILKGRS